MANKKYSQYADITTLADGDFFPCETAAGVTKYALWSLIKSTLKTYFDTLYYTIGAITSPLAISQPFPVGLLVKRNAGAPNTKIDITFAELYVQGKLATAGTYTVDQAASGVLGLDTGSVAQSTWYYFWIICKEDGTTAAIMSASSTAPTMPAGYTRKRFVTVAYTAVTTKYFYDFTQSENAYKWTSGIVMVSDSTADIASRAEVANVDVSAFMPLLITKIIVNFTVQATSTPAEYISANAGGYLNGIRSMEDIYISFVGTATVLGSANAVGTIITDNRKIYWRSMSNTNSNSSITQVVLNGFEIPLN